MRNALAVAGLVLLTAACGAYHFPGNSPSPSPETAHVSGIVRSVPCAPVEQAGSTCAGRPVASLEIDYVAGNSVVSRVVTNSSGMYAVDLRPGTYEVKLVTYMRVISGPTKLTLGAGTRTVANYMLDNGIRVPVPAQ
ncbi:MAG: hypothetical protein AUH80_02860 [Chloroflexi bacterium 13_1_40CM_4_65_16]|nr:MAG: hypothetical protein AUH27_03745 [Chloroflexi bacterium 13_1_40CM_66_19]OLC48418.1 MAG: hypothetical protein AUH80_02860 [Chloroflexi bacterium 13_1_40CM_4_65_16]OLD05687.1 MAG: hypothetical protein AUI87_04215 [Actinobacteria bacterium 13_1_40CM_3_66_19]TMF84055.1 MAG: hypothetical protein E6I11_08270 [Chloroflexota bacterium]